MLRRSHPQVQSVTAARSGLTDDVNARTRRYLISMGIRTVCFIGAVVVDGPLRWVLVAGAVLLPYLAVVAANAGRERGTGAPPTLVLPDRHASLGPGSGPARGSTDAPDGSAATDPGPHRTARDEG